MQNTSFSLSDVSTREPRAARRARILSIWLFVMCALVALMVIVGGATRLTDSGLSITEWRPVTGAVPPLSAADWDAEFEKYKQIPEYQLVNEGMSLSAFKTIYWWEWGHRFLGRLVGAAFVFPFAVFVAMGWVGRSLGVKLLALLALGGAQGALGWYMVQSGLTERVDVSQYRLAAHLGLAIVLFAALFWTALSLRRPTSAALSTIGKWGVALAGLVYAQMILGAFVAGLRAGRAYTTWPLMDGEFVPSAYFVGAPRVSDAFETIAAVQFNHRIGAYVVALAGVAFFFLARKTQSQRDARWVLSAIIAQIVLGIATVVSATPLALGLLHQAGALAVFATALYAAYGSRASKSMTVSSSSSSSASSPIDRRLTGAPAG
ncbi:MAG: COX15/CtaA family protein [Pseudomonadota bacterium]